MDAKNDNVTSVELQDELSNRILQIRFVASTNRLLELLKEKSESKAKGIDFEDVKLNI